MVIHILHLFCDQQILTDFVSFFVCWIHYTTVLLFNSKTPQFESRNEYLPWLTQWVNNNKHMNKVPSPTAIKCLPLTWQIGKQGPEKQDLPKVPWRDCSEAVTRIQLYFPAQISPFLTSALFPFLSVPTATTYDWALSLPPGMLLSPWLFSLVAILHTSSSSSTWLPRWSSKVQTGSCLPCCVNVESALLHVLHRQQGLCLDPQACLLFLSLRSCFPSRLECLQWPSPLIVPWHCAQLPSFFLLFPPLFHLVSVDSSIWGLLGGQTRVSLL